MINATEQAESEKYEIVLIVVDTSREWRYYARGRLCK